MKMISKQAVGKGIGNWLDVFGIQIHEVSVIAFLEKDILAVVAAIVDVIVGLKKQRRRTCHMNTLNEDPKGFLANDHPGSLGSLARHGACQAGEPLGSHRNQAWKTTGLICAWAADQKPKEG
jgi:hypothetical protein